MGGLGNPGPQGIGAQAARNAPGVVAGAGGAYAIFTIAHLDSIFANTGGTFVGMLYAIAVFCALALFAGFVYVQSRAKPARSVSVLQLVVVGVFAAVVLVAVGVLAYRSSSTVASGACGGPSCGPGKVRLTTVFDHFKDVDGYTFPIDALPGGQPAAVTASLNNGAPHSFAQDGTFGLDLDQPQTSITISVENLQNLENAFSTLDANYANLLRKENAFQIACAPQSGSDHLSGDCLTLFRAMVINGTL